MVRGADAQIPNAACFTPFGVQGPLAVSESADPKGANAVKRVCWPEASFFLPDPRPVQLGIAPVHAITEPFPHNNRHMFA